jgi:hypothetical protein
MAPRPGPFNSTLQLGATRVVVPALRDTLLRLIEADALTYKELTAA